MQHSISSTIQPYTNLGAKYCSALSLLNNAYLENFQKLQSCISAMLINHVLGIGGSQSLSLALTKAFPLNTFKNILSDTEQVQPYIANLISKCYKFAEAGTVTYYQEGAVDHDILQQTNQPILKSVAFLTLVC